MSLGRASLKDNCEINNTAQKPATTRSSVVIMAVLGTKANETTTAQDSTNSNLRKSNTTADAMIAHHNSQGGVFGAKLSKVEEPVAMPKLKGRLSKVLGSNK